jgi:hypothetical protein
MLIAVDLLMDGFQQEWRSRVKKTNKRIQPGHSQIKCHLRVVLIQQRRRHFGSPRAVDSDAVGDELQGSKYCHVVSHGYWPSPAQNDAQ